jgi:hypothetical protein
MDEEMEMNNIEEEEEFDEVMPSMGPSAEWKEPNYWA